eukprot:1153994-Pelagomonas_calceolata.AAC.9
MWCSSSAHARASPTCASCLSSWRAAACTTTSAGCAAGAWLMRRLLARSPLEVQGFPTPCGCWGNELGQPSVRQGIIDKQYVFLNWLDLVHRLL